MVYEPCLNLVAQRIDILVMSVHIFLVSKCNLLNMLFSSYLWMFCLFLFRHKLNNSKCPRSPQAAALAMDESILDADQVENLIKFCPTKEEMELLKVKLYLKLLIVHVFCQCHLQWDYFLFVCVRDNIFVLC